ncbi:hypothetical protein [Lysinibacter cavernae]|uniref:Uncharacterized protein n=1 Tax=Lysinibacter cavernae TaxID=1640652 RepID=A0A7X5R2K8_9MICO|nr:hypothetical protein [Lysinibacter cavernae]NIH54528.1 hypothetical protein [Lysinibacter cavernae]
MDATFFASLPWFAWIIITGAIVTGVNSIITTARGRSAQAAAATTPKSNEH